MTKRRRTDEAYRQLHQSLCAQDFRDAAGEGIAFEFVNDPPYEPGSRVKELNPLAKVPVLIADDGEVFYDSPVVAEYLELLAVEPAFLPADRAAALRVRRWRRWRTA